MKQITIIYVAYNSNKVISESLSKISSLIEEFEIIIVDNSPENSLQASLEEKYPSIKYIHTGENLGYGRGNNIGLKLTETPYALILNPDIEFHGEDILKLLEKTKEHPNAAITAPATDNNQYNPKAKQPESVPWVVGACMLLNMNIMKKIGFFDDNIFLYYEETLMHNNIKKQEYEILRFDDILAFHDAGNSSSPSNKVEYLKYWHTAWSKSYYNNSRLPRFKAKRKLFTYQLKNIFKLMIYTITNNYTKKIKYSARLAGCFAYIFGQKAFDENDNPRGLRDDL